MTITFRGVEEIMQPEVREEPTTEEAESSDSSRMNINWNEQKRCGLFAQGKVSLRGHSHQTIDRVSKGTGRSRCRVEEGAAFL